MSKMSSSLKMKLVHVSHAPYAPGLMCDGGSCPAVYETNRDTYVIIGRRMSAGEKEGLPMDGIEDALEVPRELLRESASKLT
jgi:hypothetical protein